MRTLANSEYLDEMLHHATFHQGLHYLPRQKQSSVNEIQVYSIYTMDHPGQFECIKSDGRIHWLIKG